MTCFLVTIADNFYQNYVIKDDIYKIESLLKNIMQTIDKQSVNLLIKINYHVHLNKFQ